MAASPALAGEVEVLDARFDKTQGDAHHVSATLRHADAGWDHYADAWRVETADGTVLGTRELLHPHDNEQPFTRSLSGVRIPDGITTVYIAARDTQHGWAKTRLKVDLAD